MRLTIRHRTRYTFDGEAFLEPHVVRLRPRPEPGVRLHSYALHVDPAPAVRADYLDAYGNEVTRLWFGGSTTGLTLDSRAVVERTAVNPFEFIIDGDSRLPRVYATRLSAHLAPYLDAPDGVADPVRALAWTIARDEDLRPDRFVTTLAAHLHDAITYTTRDHGPAQPAGVTLASGVGACRDLAVLFVACCRAVGMAARFVSGYAHVGDDTPAELHAWAEAYLPGGGWRGFDPADGLAVSSRHVAVAAGPEAEDAAPVAGSYRSAGADSRLETTLTITLDAAPGV